MTYLWNGTEFIPIESNYKYQRLPIREPLWKRAADKFYAEKPFDLSTFRQEPYPLAKQEWITGEESCEEIINHFRIKYGVFGVFPMYPADDFDPVKTAKEMLK